MTAAPLPTLSGLIRARDESLRVRPARRSALVALARRLRTLNLSPARRALAATFLAVAGFTSRHALVLAGCTASVIAASTLSVTAAWIMTALSLFFLEARRR